MYSSRTAVWQRRGAQIHTPNSSRTNHKSIDEQRELWAFPSLSGNKRDQRPRASRRLGVGRSLPDKAPRARQAVFSCRNETVSSRHRSFKRIVKMTWRKLPPLEYTVYIPCLTCAASLRTCYCPPPCLPLIHCHRYTRLVPHSVRFQLAMHML